jgi:HSP20 family protein
MVLQRWDPFAEVRRFHHTFNRDVRNDFGRQAWVSPTASNGTAENDWRIPLDAVEEGDNLVLRASVPGVDPDDIEVTIEDGVLSIKGESKAETEDKVSGYLMRERRSGSFHRSIRLPETIDADKAESGYENGVLTITLPRIEAKKAKRLAITVGRSPEANIPEVKKK